MNTKVTRNDFHEAFSRVFDTESLVEQFLYKISTGFTTESYVGFLHDDTVYIIDLDNEELITWYKLDHIGRALKITNPDWEISNIYDMFTQIKSELELE